ncbi:1,4-beta-D-glucan glucohydrolase [Vibrio sp. HA2012]|uniref:glycoside hydrolase family 3 protein n=1 Tax=Vibrio sp. HA2012 TaxID=1971595 RepID=UPI000C2B55E4|nr:glycoside hydrolase family 3 protein [Vibrio sp. HA2012]PJC88139.1 1,4-beta-D-glucan glucohydrolase [Vibrio sp. HA2012]
MTTDNTHIPYFSEWPKINSAIPSDPTIEKRIARIVSLMTIKEKVGQMIQPNLRDVTPQELREYKLGSILNGGGTWPNENKHAGAREWAEKADEFWYATEQAFEHRPFRIPFIWATDAVHGHNNVFGATIFPHNIGLGAARDPELIRRIGEVTAREVCATGLDWTFAPTVATPRNLRWGRTYEGYSEDPEITYLYASAMVEGLQGDAATLKSDQKVISNVKHWVGDGGTGQGTDRGNNTYSEDLLRNIHAMGYFSGLTAGAQVVMSSFNRWENPSNYDHSPEYGTTVYNEKLHGSRYLLNDVLKQQMGFDGVVVTDWHGHSEVSKCSDGNATYAINAGNDILMVPVRQHWKAVYEQTLRDIENGHISIARIDDAVTRILRIKMRAGLWDKPTPSKRLLGGNNAIVGADKHRMIAREAVRKSLVLLKNNHNLLPLANTTKILLTGSGADNIQKQCGGWNLTWQGDENTRKDFPGSCTVKDALTQEIGSQRLLFDPELTSDLSVAADVIDVAIVVFGEDPYAEMMGDIKEWQTLEFSALKRSYRRDVAKINRLREMGIKVVSVFFSGRPLFLNQEISASDAFVAAFLPGSEGRGITDVLIGDENAQPRYDFNGRLSYSWPNKKMSAAVNRIPPHIPGYQVPDSEQDPNSEHAPLFPYGYGLCYRTAEATHMDLDHLPLDLSSAQEGSTILELYGVRATIGDYLLSARSPAREEGFEISRNNPIQTPWLKTIPYNYQLQQDAVELECYGEDSVLYLQTSDKEDDDLNFFVDNHGVITFSVQVLQIPDGKVLLSTGPDCIVQQHISDSCGAFDITRQLQEASPGEWTEITVSFAELEKAGAECRHTDIPFVFRISGRLHMVLGNVRLTTVS